MINAPARPFANAEEEAFYNENFGPDAPGGCDHAALYDED